MSEAEKSLETLFDENFVERRVIFPFRSRKRETNEDYIMSINLMMDRGEYEEATADFKCPKNEHSHKFYLHLKVRGAELCQAKDGNPIIMKFNQQCDLVTAYNMGVREQETENCLSLYSLFPRHRKKPRRYRKNGSLVSC